MRRIILLAATVAACALAFAAGASAGGSYAFSSHQVLVRQGALRWALDHLFSDLAPIDVRCWGLQPTTLQGGSRGFMAIRCTTSLNVPDWIYRLNGSGTLYVTRSW